MLKKSYLVIGSIIFCLLFSFKVEAATTIITNTIPVTNGQSITIFTHSFTDVLGENLSVEGGSEGDTYAIFQPSYNVSLSGLNQNYINGYAVITVYTNPSITGSLLTTYDGVEYTRPDETDGVNVVLVSYNYNYFSFVVTFDNFYTESGRVDLGTVTQKYQAKIGDITPIKGNFTASISYSSNNLVKDSYIRNNRTTELIYNAIYQATGQDLLNIINTLSAIYTQDYTYYVQLITKLNQLHTDNTQLHTDILNLINEIDLDFQQVQTILDLFPSYRTQVLQYWQQLLEMNAAQSSAAAEMDQNYGNKETQSAQLIDGLGSLNLPQVNQNDFNILGNVDSDSKTNFFGLIGLITNNSLITTILIIIVTGSIVGYALYGKK